MDASPYYSCCGRGNESQKKTYDADGNVVQMPLFYDNYFVPARLRLRRRRPRRHQPLRRLRGRRRPLRRPVRQGRRRLAERPGRAYTTRTGDQRGQGRLDQRQHRHDRQELGRHHRQRRRRHRRRGPEDHRPDRRHLLLVRLLLRQGRPALRLRPRAGSPTTSTSPDARATCAAVQQQLVDGAPRTGDWTAAVDRARLRQGRAARSTPASSSSTACRTSTSARKHFGQWWDALADERRRAQDLALPDRPRRPLRLPPRRVGRHPAPLVRPRTPRLRQRHRPRADGRHRARTPTSGPPSDVWPPRATRHHDPAPGQGHAGGRRHPRPARNGRAPRPSPTTRRWARPTGPRTIDTSTPDKAGFVTQPLTRDLRLSGSSKVTVTATPTTSTAHLSAVLVDLGPDTIRDYAAARRGHHHPHRPHLLGPEHHRRQRLLQGDPGQDRRRRLHGLQPRLGRPRQLRLRRARASRSPRARRTRSPSTCTPPTTSSRRATASP